MNTTYTPTSTAGILNGNIIQAPELKTGIDTPQARLAAMGNILNQNARTTTSTIGLRDSINPLDATSGAFTVTLPDLATFTAQTYYEPIHLKKVDATYNWITIAAAGSDKIEDVTTPLLSPTGTTYVLYQPDESVVLAPMFNSGGTAIGWRVIDRYEPTIIFASGYMSTNQAIGASTTPTIIEYDTTVRNIGNFFNTGSYNFNPKVPGRYLCKSTPVWASGGSTVLVNHIYLDGTRVKRTNLLTLADANAIEVTQTVTLNGTTNTIDFRAECRTVARSLVGAAGSSEFEISYLGR